MFMSLDLGEKKIGVAISNKKFVYPLCVIEFKSLRYLILELEKIIEKYEIKNIVYGLPYLKGKLSSQSNFNEDVVKQLKKYIFLPFFSIDESYSTLEAKEILKNNDIEDSLSAAIILKNYFRIIKD